jgi:hypothetical protein
MELDPRIEKSMPIEGGSMVLDRLNGNVVLSLEPRSTCSGEVCAAVLPQPVVMQLPIVSTSKDECGRTVIRAGSPLATRFAARRLIEIVDASQAECGGVDATAPVTVTLETAGPSIEGAEDVGNSPLVSRFHAAPFERLPQILPVYPR